MPVNAVKPTPSARRCRCSLSISIVRVGIYKIHNVIAWNRPRMSSENSMPDQRIIPATNSASAGGGTLSNAEHHSVAKKITSFAVEQDQQTLQEKRRRLAEWLHENFQLILSTGQKAWKKFSILFQEHPREAQLSIRQHY